MAPLGRPRASASSNRQSRGPISLPPYESPAHPLNQAAQDALHDLPSKHNLSQLKARIKAANHHLTQAAGDINDRLQAKHELHEKVKRRLESINSPSSTDPSNETLEQLQQDTEEMTLKLDQKVRDIIDAGMEIEGVQNALRELDENSAANRGNVLPTQSTLGASQFRGPKRARNTEADEDEDDMDDSQLPVQGDGAVALFKRKMVEHNNAYQAESMTRRYATHNDYKAFKSLVHDARHPGDNAPPVPHPSTWFPSESRGLPLGTTAGTKDADYDDEDFLVASERISIKCPITLQPMKNPVSSTKCVHNFEKDAIIEMINLSNERTGGDGRRGGGQKAMKCPVCEVLLTVNDLVPNPVLIRKIQRIQDAENAQNDDSDEEEQSNSRSLVGSQRQEVTSSPPPTMSAIKREKLSQAPSGYPRREASMVPNTQLENSGFAIANTADSEENDDEEDDDDEEEE